MKCIIEGNSICYTSVGEGIPVLMLHGYCLDHMILKASCEPVFEKLTGYRRVYFDLPGMGDSTASSALSTTDSMLSVILQFVDRLFEGRPFLVVGESYGGYLARGVLKQRPTQVLGICLICPATEMDISKRRLPAPRTLYKDSGMIETLSDSDRLLFEENIVVQSSENYKRFEREIKRGLDKANMPLLDRIQAEAYGFQEDINASMAAYDVPALVLTGRQDAVVGYEDTYAILRQLPRATFAILDGAGHHVQIEQPELFEAMVAEWLRRVT
jgi:pimeloyl-ACP methyl ester carboxylesterase